MDEIIKEYHMEKERREKRILAYADRIQSRVLSDSAEVIHELVEERHRQKMTQQDMADITGIRTPNLARFEGATRVPTLVMLEKYANALGKHIEIRICEDEE